MIIKCKYCGSELPSCSDASAMYCCKECSRLLGEDEVIVVEDKELEVTDGDVVVDEQSVSGEHLNGASMFLLNVFMLIPVLNIIVAMSVSNSDVKEEYKQCFSYRAVISIFTFVVCIIFVFLFAKDYKDEYRQHAKETVDVFMEKLMSINYTEIKLDELKQVDFKQIMESRYQHDTDNSDEDVTFTPGWAELDEGVFSGKKLLALVESMGEDNVFLVQTKDIAVRYGKDSYRNVGYLAQGSEILGTTKNYFFDDPINDSVEIFVDDYGDIVQIGIDDLYNKRYVYYVNPKNSYRLDILYNSEEVMVGIALTEVE